MSFEPRKSRNDPTPLEGNSWWYTTGVRNTSLRNGWEGNPFLPHYGLPNCTCYAYGRWCEIQGVWGQVPYLRGASDGGKWYANAVAQNYSVGNTPSLGAIVCYGNSPLAGRPGHVAVVEEIKSNGNIVISQSGWDKYNRTPSSSRYFWTSEVTPANNYCAPWVTSRDYRYSLQGFIYLPNQPAPTTSISDYVISAICGNFAVESTLNPNVWGNFTKPDPPDPTNPDSVYSVMNAAFGLPMFLNSIGSGMYLETMYNWVSGHGYDVTEGDGQLDFIFTEKRWNNPTPPYNSFDDFINSISNNLDELTDAFRIHWEGTSQGETERRNHAQYCYQYITAHKNDNPQPYYTAGWQNTLNANLLSGGYSDEFHNNLMLIYFWITKGVPTPDPPEPTPEKYHKMPLWMMLHYGL